MNTSRQTISIALTAFLFIGALDRSYELADSQHKETRNVCLDALAAAKPEDLDPRRVFALTESRIRSTRDAALREALAACDRAAAKPPSATP